MICCFMNFHEKENAKDLEKHLDKEIQDAINFGCTVFISGKNHPEDKVFEERVKLASERYGMGEVQYVGISAPDAELLDLFIHIADWESYAYEEI